MANEAFPFIASNGRDLNYSLEIRTLIRVKAMTNVAATRRKLNRRTSDAEPSQPPIGPRRPAVQKKTSKPKSHRAIPARSESTSPAPSASLPSSDYDIACIKYGVDIRDVAMLTNFNVGRATIITLTKHPKLLFGLLRQSSPVLSQKRQQSPLSWSYIRFIPRLYGHSEPLTAAVDSVFCALRLKLNPTKTHQTNAYSKHSQALQKLQSAIQDPTQCEKPEIMCATQLLALREILEFRNTTIWEDHLKGCMILAKHRTPASYQNDLDKALLLSYAGAVTFDAIVNNEHCHLADPEWSAAYRSLAMETACLTETSPLAIDIRCIAFRYVHTLLGTKTEFGTLFSILRLNSNRLPGLWCDVTTAIEGEDLFNDAKLAPLAHRARVLRDEVLQWFVGYQQYCHTSRADEAAMQREISGAAIECLAILMRLLGTLCDHERLAFEREAQTYAGKILSLQKHNPECGWLYSAHEVGTAKAILKTRSEWEDGVSYPSDHDRRMAIRGRFHNWSESRCDREFERRSKNCNNRVA